MGGFERFMVKREVEKEGKYDQKGKALGALGELSPAFDLEECR